MHSVRQKQQQPKARNSLSVTSCRWCFSFCSRMGKTLYFLKQMPELFMLQPLNPSAHLQVSPFIQWWFRACTSTVSIKGIDVNLKCELPFLLTNVHKKEDSYNRWFIEVFHENSPVSHNPSSVLCSVSEFTRSSVVRFSQIIGSDRWSQ